MIEMKPCRGCGRPLIIHKIANLTVRLETEPLDLNGIMGELAASRSLWMVDNGKVRPARPGEAGPLREHRCSAKAADAPLKPSQTSTPPGVPANPPVRPSAGSRRSSGRRTDSSTPGFARGASRTAPARSDTHPCDVCRGPVVMDGPELYAAIELGAAIVWAVHAECGGR